MANTTDPALARHLRLVRHPLAYAPTRACALPIAFADAAQLVCDELPRGLVRELARTALELTDTDEPVDERDLLKLLAIYLGAAATCDSDLPLDATVVNASDVRLLRECLAHYGAAVALVRARGEIRPVVISGYDPDDQPIDCYDPIDDERPYPTYDLFDPLGADPYRQRGWSIHETDLSCEDESKLDPEVARFGATGQASAASHNVSIHEPRLTADSGDYSLIPDSPVALVWDPGLWEGCEWTAPYPGR